MSVHDTNLKCRSRRVNCSISRQMELIIYDEKKIVIINFKKKGKMIKYKKVGMTRNFL